MVPRSLCYNPKDLNDLRGMRRRDDLKIAMETEALPTPAAGCLVITAGRNLPPVVRRLFLVRALRSVGQGIMVVDFTLYLHALGWQIGQVGLLLTAAGLFGALLSLGVGLWSDRWGRKPFVLTYEALTVTSALVAFTTSNPALLASVTILASFGRGQGGGAGPFGPAEQAWISTSVAAVERGPVMSANAAVGFLGMGIGSLLAGLPVVLAHWLPGPLAFRPLFLLPALASTLNLFLVAGIGEHRMAAPPRIREDMRRENQDLGKLVLANTVNGLAVGMIGPLMAVWFNLRFGVSPAAIGTLMGVASLATAGSSLAIGLWGRRAGVVRSIVWMRLIGAAFLLILPLMPSYAWAAAIYFVRMVLSRGSFGARQALSTSLTGDARRGFASSLNFVSMRLPASFAPALTGYLFDQGDLALPLFLSAGLQTVYALLYGTMFGRYDRVLSAKSLDQVPPSEPGDSPRP